MRITLGPTEPPACRPEMLREVRKLSETYKVPITIHAAETRLERDYIKDEYGRDSIMYLAENGIIGPDVIYAHTVYALSLIHISCNSLYSFAARNCGKGL